MGQHGMCQRGLLDQLRGHVRENVLSNPEENCSCLSSRKAQQEKLAPCSDTVVMIV